MEQLPAWASVAISIGGLIGSLVTAIATIFLWKVTQVLARETQRMVDATSQPHIVATLDPNRWSMRHFDLNVQNTGTGTAYDITINFDPPLRNGEGRKEKDNPLQKISVLKPGQGMNSYLSDYASLDSKSYNVTVSWLRRANAVVREENSYTLNMNDIKGVSALGGEPSVKMAEYLKKIQEDISHIGRKNTRIEVDAFLASDRLHERRVSQRQMRQWRQEHVQPNSIPREK